MYCSWTLVKAVVQVVLRDSNFVWEDMDSYTGWETYGGISEPQDSAKSSTNAVDVCEKCFEKDLVQESVTEANCSAEQFKNSWSIMFCKRSMANEWQAATVEEIYSAPSSYDRLDLRTTWVTNKNFSFDLRPKSWVTTRMPVKATWVTTRVAFVSVSLIPDTRVCGRNSGQCAVLYIINFAKCYQNGPKKPRK
jgi:hypothetical protein